MNLQSAKKLSGRVLYDLKYVPYRRTSSNRLFEVTGNVTILYADGTSDNKSIYDIETKDKIRRFLDVLDLNPHCVGVNISRGDWY